MKWRLLNHKLHWRHPVRKLGEGISWSDFAAFGEYYSEEERHAKLVGLIYAKLLLPVTKNHLRVFQGRL
jgi:hypothetical protein